MIDLDGPLGRYFCRRCARNTQDIDFLVGDEAFVKSGTAKVEQGDKP